MTTKLKDTFTCLVSFHSFNYSTSLFQISFFHFVILSLFNKYFHNRTDGPLHGFQRCEFLRAHLLPHPHPRLLHKGEKSDIKQRVAKRVVLVGFKITTFNVGFEFSVVWKLLPCLTYHLPTLTNFDQYLSILTALSYLLPILTNFDLSLTNLCSS